MEKLIVELKLSKQRTEEARKIADLNQLRAEAAEQEVNQPDDDTVQNFLKKETTSGPIKTSSEDTKYVRSSAPIRLKGVDIPKFSGEDKSDYKSWKTAFMSVVDCLNIPTGEKMLRLQASLSGKAHSLVKDLGYSLSAYERAKKKLEKKYGGERRLRIKHLTTLRNWKKIRARHLGTS